jgi:hypothetical protein
VISLILANPAKSLPPDNETYFYTKATMGMSEGWRDEEEGMEEGMDGDGGMDGGRREVEKNNFMGWRDGRIFLTREVITPNHLTKQWKEEIERHTKPQLKVFVVTTMASHKRLVYQDIKDAGNI